MDENFIYERLKALSGGTAREQYRDISKAFAEVIKYNKGELEKLRNQINQEIRDVSARFYLYGAVMKSSDAPMVNDFLFPMSGAAAGDSIGTIFCECPLREMEEIFSKEQVLLIETPEGIMEISAKIRPCRRYLEQIDILKKTYYENGIFWRTPYLPYVSKFGDVYCEAFDKQQTVLGFRFKNRDIVVKHDMIPLWNVEKINLKCTVFPIPAIDEKNYKHILKLPYPQDGYAVLMDQAIKNVYYSDEDLVLVTEEKLQRDFFLYRIAVKRFISVPHYPLTTNYRPMRHIDRQAQQSMVSVRSRAEIGRIVSSYEASGGLKFIGALEGKAGDIDGNSDHYEFAAVGRESLLLMFSAKTTDFTTMDRISFLVHEVQYYFPQYLVTGRLCGPTAEGIDIDEKALAGRDGNDGERLFGK